MPVLIFYCCSGKWYALSVWRLSSLFLMKFSVCYSLMLFSISSEFQFFLMLWIILLFMFSVCLSPFSNACLGLTQDFPT